jgi:hypothetical protein
MPRAVAHCGVADPGKSRAYVTGLEFTVDAGNTTR